MALNGIKMDGQSYTYALLDDKRMTSLQGQAVIHYILLSTVCLKKNIPDIFSCNSRKHCRIFIMFGTHVTEKVSNQ